jgi:NAD(P)-dependent dehydrogenase (short-subunit alcohol dehydrogenase family)
MTKRFEDKVAVVTGSASGIGAAVSRMLIGEGALVVGADIGAAAQAALAAELGERYIPVSANVTVEAEVKDLVGVAMERFGRLDLGFNVAGGGRLSMLMEMSEADWDFTVDLCLKGVFLCTKHEAAVMTPGSAIVNVASLNAQVPAHGFSAYTSAKAGVEMFSRNAALGLAGRGIRVNCVLPGLVETPATGPFVSNQAILSAFMERIPAKRPAQPAEIAAPCLFLASPEASYVSGSSLLVDGAWGTTGYPDLRTWMGEFKP